jgi:sn-glycerol 3-phosphate transport system substrate-binding protein
MRLTSNRFGRRTLLAGAGGLLAAAAAGCGSREFTQATGALPRQYAKRTHVVFWHSFSSVLEESMTKLVDEFNESQQEVYVDAQFQGSYDQTVQKISAGIIARQIPDLAIFSEITWRKMHMADALEPLNDYFGGGYVPGNYLDQFINEGRVKGTYWWIPFARSTPLFYYNKEIFEKAGVPAEGPKKWTDLLEWGPAIQSVQTKNGNPKVHAFTSGDADWFFQGSVWQHGGRYSDGLDILVDSEAGIAAGQWNVDLIRKHKMAYLTVTPAPDFTNQVNATGCMSTGGLREVTELAKFEVGTTFLPEFEHFGCPTGGSGFGILRGAAKERKEAAFEFVKFCGRPEKSAQWTMESGYLPIVRAARDVPALRKRVKENPNFATALAQVPKTRTQDLARLIIPNANVTMSTALQKLYSSTASVEDTFHTLARKLRSSANLLGEKYAKHYL